MSKESYFFNLLKEGKVQFSEDGRMFVFNEGVIHLPVRVLNKLFFLIKENLNEEKASDILKELGKFQTMQSFQRYKKILNLDNMPSMQLLEFGIKLMLSLGLGKYNVKRNGENFIFSISKTPFAEEFILEYGKQPYPIDYYISGIIEKAFTYFFAKEMVCEETKCYAKGDDCCEFVVKPKE